MSNIKGGSKSQNKLSYNSSERPTTLLRQRNTQSITSASTMGTFS